MKKPKEIKPLFALKPDYEASLAEFIHQAGMLADAVSLLLSFKDKVSLPEPIADQLSERLAAFNKSRFGDGD